MRRKDRERSRRFAYEVLDRCDFAVLAIAGEDAAPYCIPLHLVRAGDSLYFHAAREGKKAVLLRRSPAVCITAACDVQIDEARLTTRYASVVATGTARELTDPEDRLRALRLLCARFTPNHPAIGEQPCPALNETAVWQIRMEDVSGKCNAPV